MTKKEPAEGSTPQEAPPLNIHQAMAHILAEIGPIAKKKENLEQGYRFRGIDAAMDALNPLMAKYGVFPTTKDIETVIYETVTSAK